MKAFTLIELLIVIAVMGVLAGGVMITINPKDKIDSANDARVQSDISGISRALQNFATSNNGLFPDGNSPTLLSSGGASGNATTILGGTGGLVASAELGSIPTPPSGYGTSYTYYWDNSDTPPRAKIIGTLKSQKSLTQSGGAAAVWAWCSWTGTMEYGTSFATNLTVCP